MTSPQKMSWRKEPPTYEEWMGAKNHGAWWVKFMIAPEETVVNEETEREMVFPEAWYTDVVMITCSYEKGKLLDDREVRLHGRGQVLGNFDLDDEELMKKLYWQPVKPPDDDVRDQRPIE